VSSVRGNAFRGLLLPGLFAAVGIAILVSLGVWQLERLAWKEALISRVEAGLVAEPIAAPGPEAWPGLDLAAMEYQPVTVEGRYLNDREVHVVATLTQPKGPAGGIGYFVMTPFATDDGWTVYVNRGFVPREKKNAPTRSQGLIAGATAATGLLRAPSRRSWFTPGDSVSDNQWFSRDPAAFAAANGQPGPIAPYIIDARFDPNLPGGLPQGGETIVTFSNNHLQYALTWFGLAAALAAVFGAFAWSRVARGSD
jgi:surfeit locus 1 family protein